MKKRIIRRENGVEVKFTAFFTNEELAIMERTRDDPNMTMETLSSSSHDQFLAFLRIMMFWRDTTRDTTKNRVVIESAMKRRQGNEAKNRKDKRVRSRRKKK